jgi:peptidoglycan/LPS O-acetylase OafA/YrhL
MQRRQTSLDGLRGIAVLMVLLRHHGLFNPGWVGVDLFFVLSGYLITSILRRTRNDPTYYREFWVKRVTRILPPLILLLIVTLFLDRTMGKLVFLNLLSLGDIVAYLSPHYEAPRILWSLAVEEHFYLLWPLLVRRLHRKQLVALLLSVIIVEPILRGVVVYWKRDMDLIYFLTPFRLDGLSLGALLALLLESQHMQNLLKRTSFWACISCASIFILLKHEMGSAFAPGSALLFNTLAYSLISLTAFFLISHLLTQPSTVLGHILSTPVLVFVGTISYGMYVYQIVIRDQCMRFLHMPVKEVLFISLPATICIGWLSFQLYELPLVRWGKHRAEQLRQPTPRPK